MRLFKNRVFLASALFALVALFVTYQAVRSYHNKAQVAHVKELSRQMSQEFSLSEMTDMIKKKDKTKEKEWQDRQRQLQDEVKKLPEDDRREIRKDQMRQGLGMAKMIINLPKPVRNLFVDHFIDRMEEDRKRREQRAKENGGSTASTETDGSRSGGDERGRPGSKMSHEERTRHFLDHSTPEDRANMAEVIGEGIRVLNQRRKERGLPPAPLGGPRR